MGGGSGIPEPTTQKSKDKTHSSGIYDAKRKAGFPIAPTGARRHPPDQDQSRDMQETRKTGKMAPAVPRPLGVESSLGHKQIERTGRRLKFSAPHLP
jgi:hypothetical protein